jgi:hypothetical protein
MAKKWKINVYGTKSPHITFALGKGHRPAVNIDQTITPQKEAVKYVGLHLDCRLNWNENRHKRETSRLKNTRDQLVNKKSPIYLYQKISYLQSDNQTYIRAKEQNCWVAPSVQHKLHAEISIQNS